MIHQIGERQRWAWRTAALSGILATGICGYGWLWVLLGGTLVGLLDCFLDQKLGSRSMAQVLGDGTGGKILAGLILLWTVIAMSWCACLADAAFPKVNGFPGLGWVLLALAAYGSCRGAAACARCSGVLCLFLLFLYGIVAVFSLPDVKLAYLAPQGNWQNIVPAAGLFLLSAGVWYAPTGERKEKSWQFAFIPPVAAAALTAITAGVLSPELAAVRQVPIYDLAQSVNVLGVIERIDPMLSAAMTVGLFALLSSLCCSCRLLGEKIKKKIPWAAVCAAAAGAGMFLTKSVSVRTLTQGNVVFYGAVPLLAVCLKKSQKKMKKVVDK